MRLIFFFSRVTGLFVESTISLTTLKVFILFRIKIKVTKLSFFCHMYNFSSVTMRKFPTAGSIHIGSNSRLGDILYSSVVLYLHIFGPGVFAGHPVK